MLKSFNPLTPTGHQCPTIPGKDKNVMASEILSKWVANSKSNHSYTKLHEEILVFDTAGVSNWLIFFVNFVNYFFISYDNQLVVIIPFWHFMILTPIFYWYRARAFQKSIWLHVLKWRYTVFIVPGHGCPYGWQGVWDFFQKSLSFIIFGVICLFLDLSRGLGWKFSTMCYSSVRHQ